MIWPPTVGDDAHSHWGSRLNPVPGCVRWCVRCCLPTVEPLDLGVCSACRNLTAGHPLPDPRTADCERAFAERLREVGGDLRHQLSYWVEPVEPVTDGVLIESFGILRRRSDDPGLLKGRPQLAPRGFEPRAAPWTMEVWRRTVRHPSSPVMVAADWLADGRRSGPRLISIVERPSRNALFQALAVGYYIGLPRRKGGPGQPAMTREEFWDVVTATRVRFAAARMAPRPADFALACSISTTTYRRYVTTWGLPPS